MDQSIHIPGEIPPEIPKPELEEPKNKTNVWLRTIVSLALFLVLGYYFFGKPWPWVFALTAVVIFHEMGHFLAMKFYNYKELGIFFIPLMGAYVSGKKQEVSQKQSAIILLAGPMPGIILGVLFYFIAKSTGIDFFREVAVLLFFLNLLNLLPVYPLDGGQLLHRLFLDNYNILSKLFVVVSAGFMIWVAIISGFYPILLFPFMMISRMIGDLQHERIEKRIEDEGIDLMKTYEDLTPEEYWRIRNAVIRHYSQFKDVNPSPPYEISSKEEQIIMTIQGLLQRSLTQDLSLGGKLLILLIWVGSFVAPFFLNLSIIR